jgi:hypothetical protein
MVDFCTAEHSTILQELSTRLDGAVAGDMAILDRSSSKRRYKMQKVNKELVIQSLQHRLFAPGLL